MTEQLRVTLTTGEIAAIRHSALRRGMTPSDWAAQAIRSALRCESSSSVLPKLAAVRDAIRHSFPTADIDQMLAEIAGSQT